MSNSQAQSPSPTVSNAKLERKLRLSLPEKERSPQSVVAPGSRRNTISEDSLPRVRKKSKTPLTPAIPEDENETETTVKETRKETRLVIEDETKNNVLLRSSSTNSRRSPATLAVSSRSSRSAFSYDNGAFEGNLKSIPNEPSRTPSVRSLEVYREQYCCCARRTKCERYLLVVVTLLAIIVIVLVLVIAIIAKNCNDR